MDSASDPCFSASTHAYVVLARCGRRVRGLGPGLTSESAPAGHVAVALASRCRHGAWVTMC